MCVPHGSINSKAALIREMAWRQTGDNPLPESTLTQVTEAYNIDTKLGGIKAISPKQYSL